MKTQNIFRKVGSILAEINEQYQYLSESPQNLNDLELELLSANADFLAEHMKVLRKLNLSEGAGNVTALSKPEDDITHSKQYQENISNPPDFNTQEDSLIKQELPESYTSFHKPIEQEMPTAIEAEEISESNRDAEEISESNKDAEETDDRFPGDDKAEDESETEEVQGKSVFNSFFVPEPEPLSNDNKPILQAEPHQAPELANSGEAEEEVSSPVPPLENTPEKIPTLNELMSAQMADRPMLGQLNTRPVTDLKAIINLNDKLLFIKDLFNGYSLAYSEAIEIINRFDSFDAADNFLKTNYSTKNNWAAKQSTAEKFYELLNRRFSK